MIRSVLADATTWPDAMLNQWIADALKDYSQVFPYRLTDEVAGSLFSAVRTYSLQAYKDMIGLNVYRVEYPAYENPPKHLARLSESHPSFTGAGISTSGTAFPACWCTWRPLTRTRAMT